MKLQRHTVFRAHYVLCFSRKKCFWMCGNMKTKPNHSFRCFSMTRRNEIHLCVCGSGGDGSCPGGDPARSPVGRQPPLRPGTHRPAVQWAAAPLWHHHYSHTHQAGFAHSSARPAAPPWGGKDAEICTHTLKENTCKLTIITVKSINLCASVFHCPLFSMQVAAQTTSSVSCMFVLILKC